MSKFIGLAASISLVASLIFDWGFYLALNLSFLEIPTVLSDHVRSSLIWFPKVVTAFGGAFVLEMLIKRTEHGMTEEEIINSSPNPQHTKRLRDRPWKMIAYISVFSVIAYLLAGDIFLDGLAPGLIISWIMFSTWAQDHSRILNRKPFYMRLAAIFIPAIAIWLFFAGFNDAVKMFQSSTQKSQLTLANTTSPEHVTLLRQLDKGLLVKNVNNTVVFWPWNEIKKVETSGKYVPSKGILCSWFGLACVQILP